MKERGNRSLRWIDRYFGIALILMLRPFKRKRRFRENFQKIALLKSAGIGDIVLLSAIVRDIKEKYPEKDIVLFCGRANYEAALLVPAVEVVCLPITRPLTCLKQIREFPFDVFIDCDPWPRINALLAFFSRSFFTIGFRTKYQFRHYLFDLSVPHSGEIHELENYRNLVKSLNVPHKYLPFFSVSAQEFVKSKVALHLYAGGLLAPIREWPNKNWHGLIHQLLKWECQIVMTGSPRDREKLKEFENYPSLQIAAGYTLKETAELLRSCQLVVSVNTGIMHLAAALGCLVVCLHGPSTPKRWGAKGETVIDITPQHGYNPTLNLGFERKGIKNRDMEKITLDQVVDVLRNYLVPKESV